jgi:hypothetical protein
LFAPLLYFPTTPLNFMAYIEYRRFFNFGKLVKTSSLEMKLSSSNLKLNHVLIQRKFGDIFKLSCLDSTPKHDVFFWCFFSCVEMCGKSPMGSKGMALVSHFLLW